jgi:hypothetical protein
MMLSKIWRSSPKVTFFLPPKISNGKILDQLSPKKEFLNKMKDLNRSFDEHEKEGFPHLDDVEKKIRNRRRKARPDVTMPNDDKTRQESPLSKFKISDYSKGGGRPVGGSKDRSRIARSKDFTPDDLYEKLPKRVAQGKLAVGGMDTEANGELIQKLSTELVACREENHD